MAKLEEIGVIAHYYPKIGVAIVDLKAALSVGDRILVKGPATNLEQTVNSMQIEHKNVAKAMAGQSIGLKIDGRVREKDLVYKVLQAS